MARGTTARSPPHKVQARRFGAWARGVKGERGRRLTLGNSEPRGPRDTFRQSGDPGVPLNKRGAIRGTLWDPGRCVPLSGRPRWWLGRGIVAKGAFPRSKAAGGGLGGLSRPMHRRLRSILGVGVDRPDAAGGAAPATPVHAHPRTRRPPCSPALRSPVRLFVRLFVLDCGVTETERPTSPGALQKVSLSSRHWSRGLEQKDVKSVKDSGKPLEKAHDTLSLVARWASWGRGQS